MLQQMLHFYLFPCLCLISSNTFDSLYNTQSMDKNKDFLNDAFQSYYDLFQVNWLVQSY